MVSRGKFDGGSLVLRSDDGGRAEIALTSIVGRDSGTIQLVGAKQFGSFKFKTKVKFPQDVEMYVIRGNDRYDPPLKIMVSSPVVMGKMKTTTRHATGRPRRSSGTPSRRPATRTRTPTPISARTCRPLPQRAGTSDSSIQRAGYLAWTTPWATWDKQKTVSQLTPVYRADQPRSHTARSVAHKGYAVAGAKVNADKYVNGIRLLFRRVKPDGTLDEKGGYTGEWIGAAPAGKATTLVNDGRRVLGIRIQRGAIIDRFALVVEGQEQ